MKKDPFIIRLRAKFEKELRLQKWRRWVKNCQYENWLDRQCYTAIGVASREDALNVIKSQPTINLLIGDPEISSLNSNYDGENLSILGANIHYANLATDWHKDWRVDAEWPKKWHWLSNNCSVPGADIKIPWETSRCQYFSEWAKRYVQTGNPEYAERYVNTISAWILHNPVGKGVNWACTMEVAIRAANWLLVYPVFADAEAVTDSFVWELFRSLYVHANYIKNNLEGPGWYAANHYLANLAGLYFISVFCPVFGKEAEHWELFSRSELEKEINRQVLTDGVSFEQSTAYHRLSFELLFYPYLLSTHTSLQFSKHYLQQLEKMLFVIKGFTKPNGRIAQYADNDSGKFFCLGDENTLDFRYLLDLGAVVLAIPELKTENRELSMSAKRLAGKEGIGNWAALECTEPVLGMSVYSSVGWYIHQGPQWWVMTNTGPQGNHCHHAHAHDDRLSLEIAFAKDDLIVDPGTYSYTGNKHERMRFRSREYHNGLFNKDKNNTQKALFFSQPITSARVIRSESTGEDLDWGACYTCDDWHWERSLRVKEGRFSVTDVVSDPAAVEGCLNLHPEVKVLSMDKKGLSAELQTKSSRRIKITMHGVTAFDVVPSWYSSGYGQKQKALQLRYKPTSNTCGFLLEA